LFERENRQLKLAAVSRLSIWRSVTSVDVTSVGVTSVDVTSVDVTSVDVTSVDVTSVGGSWCYLQLLPAAAHDLANRFGFP